MFSRFDDLAAALVTFTVAVASTSLFIVIAVGIV